MHVMYVHQNFPAQFGHIGARLAKRPGWHCTFVNRQTEGNAAGIERVRYSVSGGATAKTHFCAANFENATAHAEGVYRALKARPDLRPDLIVGHSGFGSTLFLRELYPDVPVVNYFEYYYRPRDPGSDLVFRKDLGWPVPEMQFLRSSCLNAMIHLDLENCDAAYSPTQFQRSRFPDAYRSRIQVLFDGVERSVYHGHAEKFRPLNGGRQFKVGGQILPRGTRVVTYVSRGFESIRGFDVFMKAAKRIAELYPDVVFLIVGSDRVSYGGDLNHLDGKRSFLEWVLSRDEYDPAKFRLLGNVTPQELGRLLAATDLHVYLTAPFVLSWSMMNAMSCGAVVLGSDTAPVREMIRDGENGLLADFFDAEALAQQAVRVLRDPGAFRPLGRAAERMIEERYGVEAVLPGHLALYERAANARGGRQGHGEVTSEAAGPWSGPHNAGEPAARTRALFSTKPIDRNQEVCLS